MPANLTQLNLPIDCITKTKHTFTVTGSHWTMQLLSEEVDHYEKGNAQHNNMPVNRRKYTALQACDKEFFPNICLQIASTQWTDPFFIIFIHLFKTF